MENKNTLTPLEINEIEDINNPFEFHMTEKDLVAIRKYWTVPWGEIVFENDEQASNAAEKIKEFLFNLNAEIVDTTKILNIHRVTFIPNSERVFYEAFSETEENMYWQLNELLNFCKTLPGMKEFDNDVLKTVEPVAWQLKK